MKLQPLAPIALSRPLESSAVTNWLSAEQQAIWRAYIVGSNLLTETLDRELREAHGISLAEYEVMVRLSERPDRSMRMAHLADSLSYSRSRVTHTIKRMQTLGLVERQASESDRRGVYAVMTDHGYRVLVEAAPTHVAGVRAHFVDLVPDADYAAVGRVMDAVMEHLLADNPHYRAADLRPK